MAKPTPATIEYITTNETSFDSITAENARVNDFIEGIDEATNIIRFHAVVSEDHSARTKITKFPVQSGFNISNHAIKQNRGIRLQGLFTNTILEGTEQVLYGSNNSKAMFKALGNLVRSATPCKVTTNLGVYEPVIFKKFTTKQQKGMVDSIEVIIDGEEVQVASNVVKTAPVKISFIPIGGDERQSFIDRLTESGIGTDRYGASIITEATSLSKADVEIGSDFVVESVTSSGEIFDVTFVSKAWDGVKEFTYDVYTGNTDVFSKASNVLTGMIADLNVPLIPSLTDLTGGLNGVTNCLLNGSSNVLVDETEKIIDTAMGVLDKTVYGAKQDIIKLGGNDAMQALIGTGLDCIALGASTALGGEANSVDEAVDEAIVAIKGIGNAATSTTATIVDGATKVITQLVKIESPVVLPLQSTGVSN